VHDQVHPQTRVHVLRHTQRSGWDLVDIILGIIMLPFGIWCLLIESMVAGMTWALDRG
jgi:hypothetical protein